MTEIELFDMRKTIKLTLIKIGIRCDLIGFSYLCYAIELVIINPSFVNSLCNNLYKKVGEKFNLEKTNCVERSIRHAIETTSNSKGFSELNSMFNSEIYSKNEKPTAGELIKLIAEYYNLQKSFKI